MVNWQESPGSLYIDPAAPDGAYLVYKSGLRFTEFLRLVNGTGTTVVIDTGAGEVSLDVTDTAAAFLVTRLPGGDPSLVFDTDGEVVYTEVLP